MVLPFRPAKFDRDISTLGISGFAETLAEGSYTAFEHSRRFRAKISDDQHRRLLCMGRKRPRCGRGSAEGDKLAPPHVGHRLSPLGRLPLAASLPPINLPQKRSEEHTSELQSRRDLV